ncbi:MAG: Gram-negative bacterial TonB protein C-terminal [Verrucomicrobiota bacterium]
MKKCLTAFLAMLALCSGISGAKGEQIEENWQPFVIYKPDPFIPMVALRKGWGGTIRCQLTINPKSGLVDEVKVVRHTGYKTLDAEMVMTFFKWKFRPGTITKATITYEVGIGGRARSLHGTEHKGDILNN